MKHRFNASMAAIRHGYLVCDDRPLATKGFIDGYEAAMAERDRDDSFLPRFTGDQVEMTLRVGDKGACCHIPVKLIETSNVDELARHVNHLMDQIRRLQRADHADLAAR